MRQRRSDRRHRVTDDRHGFRDRDLDVGSTFDVDHVVGSSRVERGLQAHESSAGSARIDDEHARARVRREPDGESQTERKRTAESLHVEPLRGMDSPS